MRRRFLMGMVLDKGIWENYSYTYLYHSLIPQTIDSKNVLNKARLGTIEGNSEVVNQLLDMTTIANVEQNNVSIINNGDGSFTISTTSAGATADTSTTQKWVSMTQGHYYCYYGIPSGASSSTYYLGGSFKKTQNEVSTLTASSGMKAFQIVVKQGTIITTPVVFRPQLTDLTQNNPFDTPTTLDDVRVQNILAQGYIPYNTGEIKDTLISELEAQQYNLFDEILEGGAINSSTGAKTSSANAFRVANPIKVIGGLSYTVEYNYASLGGYVYISEFDENKQFISQTNGISSIPYTIQLKAETRYVMLSWYKSSSGWEANTPSQSEAQVCFHRTGTRTGYAPYQAPSTLQLPAPLQIGGVNTAHNTFEITNTGYVFTRNVWELDLGSINYTYDSLHTRFYSNTTYENVIKTPANNDTIANILCNKYTTLTQTILYNGSENNAISCSTGNGRINIRNTAYTDATTFKTAMSGVPLKYQLATPQVITIPKKHLGVIDLGSLNWVSVGDYKYACDDLADIIKKPTSNSQLCNIYLEKYITCNVGQVYSQNQVICVVQAGGVWIRDTSITSATDMKNSLNNCYLCYETEDEVADFTNLLNIQSGGTVNGNMFSWVRNQLVNNGNFADNTIWNTTSNNISLSFNNKLLVSVLNGFTGQWENIQQNFSQKVVVGNKYLICAYKKSSKTRSGSSIGITSSTILSYNSYSISNTRQFVYAFVQPTSSGNNYYQLYPFGTDSVSTSDTAEFENAQCFNLTVGFGAGNEPTDINDYRIQKILNEGYIPTDTTGTNESVGCEVLPNVEMEMKCK